MEHTQCKHLVGTTIKTGVNGCGYLIAACFHIGMWEENTTAGDKRLRKIPFSSFLKNLINFITAERFSFLGIVIQSIFFHLSHSVITQSFCLILLSKKLFFITLFANL